MRIEELEPRCLLSGVFTGNVIAEMERGVLLVRGDRAANGIQITEVDDAVIVRGLDSTTINGQAEASFVGVRHLVVVTGRGHDHIEIDGVTLEPGINSLAIATGRGNDSVSVTGTSSDLVAIRTGSGRDEVRVEDSTGHLLRVYTGGQADEVELLGGVLFRRVGVWTGNGRDTVALGGPRSSDTEELEPGMTPTVGLTTLPGAQFVVRTGRHNDTVTMFSPESAPGARFVLRGGPGYDVAGIPREADPKGEPQPPSPPTVDYVLELYSFEEIYHLTPGPIVA